MLGSLMTMNVTYRGLVAISGFLERFEYVKRSSASVGDVTFGGHRYINQRFYSSNEWRTVRRHVIIRDNGFDLAHPDHPIDGRIIIHHLIPITLYDFENSTDLLLNPDNLVCVSHETHEAIHYGSSESIFKGLVERKKNDQCPWL